MSQEARIISNLKALVAAKAAREKRRIGYRTIAAETGIGESSVRNWMHSTVTKYHETHILALCKWLDCGLCDLLQIVDK